MTNRILKNICADCYHDSAEYFLLVQKLTAEYIEKIMPANYQLSPNSQSNFQRMEQGILTNLEEWKEVKKQLIKEISNYKKGDLNDNNNSSNNNQERERTNEFLPDKDRESKRQQKSQLQSQISDLENKSTRTPTEEAELARKKKELERLNNLTNNDQDKCKNNWLPPVLIIVVVCLLLVRLFIF